MERLSLSHPTVPQCSSTVFTVAKPKNMTAVLAVIPDMRKEMAPPTVSTVHKVLPCVHDEHCNDDLHNLKWVEWLVVFSPDPPVSLGHLQRDASIPHYHPTSDYDAIIYSAGPGTGRDGRPPRASEFSNHVLLG
ncbi:hypothetical protein Tco_1522299 [Tanacetum coccineum]